MAINTALLIAAPILQDYFSDNATDAAMSDGVITCYHDNSRTTLKNWYYQTGQPGAYNYLPLDNPLTLSAAGTITDPNGNDTIPFWYPYSETDNITSDPYYVTVDNSNGQRQFTRQNFPFVATANANSANATLSNLITNNVFWRNVGSFTASSTTLTTANSYSLNGSTLYFSTISPSQHDGYVNYMSDMTFVTNSTGALDVLTFTKFTNSNRLSNTTDIDATPEFYLNVKSTNMGTPETIKYIQIPIALHVDNLSQYPTASVTIWTQNPTAAGNNTLTLNLFQFLGTGVTSPVASTIVTINPSTTWQKTVATFAFPSATLPTTGPGDDAWFLQIGLPVGVTYEMNIAKPSIYLSTIPPTDDFQTYEVVSGTIDSPRTGDIRTSINSWYSYGWVPMNNGSVGNAASNANARANIDTWPLFNLLWGLFQPFNHATTNVLAQMVNSIGVNVTYGASAIADWNANNSIFLTQTMAKVLLGGSPVSTLLPTYKTTVTGSNNGGNIAFAASNTVNFFNGMPVYITTTGTVPDSIVANTIYYVANFNGTTDFNLSTTFQNAITGTVIAYGTTNGSGCSVVSGFSGTFEGEYAHTLLTKELPTHITDTAGTFAVAAGGDGSVILNTATPNNGIVINSAGGNSHNVTQPGYFANLFIKL